MTVILGWCLLVFGPEAGTMRCASKLQEGPLSRTKEGSKHQLRILMSQHNPLSIQSRYLSRYTSSKVLTFLVSARLSLHSALSECIPLPSLFLLMKKNAKLDGAMRQRLHVESTHSTGLAGFLPVAHGSLLTTDHSQSVHPRGPSLPSLPVPIPRRGDSPGLFVSVPDLTALPTYVPG